MQKLAKNCRQIFYHAISLLLVYRVKFRSEPKCKLRQKFYFQKTLISIFEVKFELFRASGQKIAFKEGSSKLYL